MGSDHAINLAGLQARNDFLCFLGGEETRQNFHLDGVASKALRECVAVLSREQSCGHKDSYLHAILNCLERSTHSDFCFAEAHISTHQAIHWNIAFHVFLDGSNCCELVRCFHKRECRFHLVLPRGIRWERVSLCAHATLIQQHKFLRDFANSRAHSGLCACKVAATHAMQCGCFATDVLTNHANLFGGDIQLVATLVRNEQVVTLNAADGALHHAFVFAHTVMCVHDIAAGLQVFEHCGGRATAGWLGSTCATPATEIGLGDNGDLGVRKRHAVRLRSTGNPCSWTCQHVGIVGGGEVNAM